MKLEEKIKTLISNENRIRSVEMMGFFQFLYESGNCKENLVKDCKTYIGMLSTLWSANDNLHTGFKNPFKENEFNYLVNLSLNLIMIFEKAKENNKINE